jgi:hypothetical protein
MRAFPCPSYPVEPARAGRAPALPPRDKAVVRRAQAETARPECVRSLRSGLRLWGCSGFSRFRTR